MAQLFQGWGSFSSLGGQWLQGQDDRPCGSMRDVVTWQTLSAKVLLYRGPSKFRAEKREMLSSTRPVGPVGTQNGKLFESQGMALQSMECLFVDDESQ